MGRGWPLLRRERAHYELTVGRFESAKRLLAALESFANEGGLISEQVWDSPDIPECGLQFGRPSGSAMPLVWAHAEYLKLRRSLRDGRVFDLPPNGETLLDCQNRVPADGLAVQPQDSLDASREITADRDVGACRHSLECR
jgi:hypothetical protein